MERREEAGPSLRRSWAMCWSRAGGEEAQEAEFTVGEGGGEEEDGTGGMDGGKMQKSFAAGVRFGGWGRITG